MSVPERIDPLLRALTQDGADAASRPPLVGAFERPSELPTLCPVGRRLLDWQRSGEQKPLRLAALIHDDPTLRGRVLQLANASQPSFAPKMEGMQVVVERMGVEPVLHSALAFSVLWANLSGHFDAFDYELFWSRSLARAVACHALSRASEVAHPLDAFALGLLSEGGRLALAGVEPGERREPGALEPHLFSLDHLEVTRALLFRWGLPSAFVDAVRGEREVHSLSWTGPVRTPDELLLAGRGLATLATTEDALSADDERRLGERIGLSPAALRDLASRTAHEWRGWCRFLSIPARGESGTLLEWVGAAPREPVVVSRKLRILAVDDDPLSLRLLERHLTRAGHEVTLARDGDEALRIANDRPPQLVVADWQMPGLDGIELCRELRRNEQGRKIYFLLLTGHGEVENVVNAFDAGVDDYVEKPFNPDVLLARIKAGLRIIDLQDQVERDKRTQKKQVAELQLLTRKLRLAAFTDVLTGLPNRRFAMKRLTQAWETSTQTRQPLSIIMIDIDDFKRVNDDYGHDVGDVVLRETARLLRSILRDHEDICRLGGEEFLVICEDSSPAESAQVAERLRACVEENSIQCGAYIGRVTLSLGVATRGRWMESSENLLKAADEAVYDAKFRGRNQVRASSGEPPAAARGA